MSTLYGDKTSQHYMVIGHVNTITNIPSTFSGFEAVTSQSTRSDAEDLPQLPFDFVILARLDLRKYSNFSIYQWIIFRSIA
jgi:hypothetical protein